MTWEKFFFKVSRDSLIALIVVYFFLEIPELVLPGIVSSHFSPKYFLVLLILAALVFIRLGKRSQPARTENRRFRAISRNLINVLLCVWAVMIILSLYRMQIWQIAIVTIFSLTLFIAAENMLIKEEEKEDY